MKQLISVPEIAVKFNCDPSLIRKRIKSMRIKTVKAISGKTKKSTTAIALKDLARLKKKFPTISAPKATAKDIPISQIARKLGRDISTILKMCESRKIKLTVKKVPNTPKKKGKKVKSKSPAMRPMKTMSLKDFNLLKKEIKSTPVV